MQIFRPIFALLGLFLFGGQLNAETLRLNGDYYVRETQNFFPDTENKVGILMAGSSFRVLNRIRLSNGAEALEIHPVSLTPKSYLRPAKKYWIYKADKSHFTKIETVNTNTQAAALDAPCTDCGTPIKPQTPNEKDLAQVSQQILTQQNTVSGGITGVVNGELDGAIERYSNSSEAAHAIHYAIRNKKATGGVCYKAVKKALVAKSKEKTSLLSSYYSDKAALNAKNTLKQFGFVNLLEAEPYKSQIKSPNQAPKGAVLVYSSGIPCEQTEKEIENKVRPVADCGHVEIKTDHSGKPGFVSDYYSKDAINETPAAKKYGTRYKLVGVMIKKMDSP